MSMQECENHHAEFSLRSSRAELIAAVMEVVHDLESWRAVEKNFESRKLIDDAARKLRSAAAK